MARYDLRPEDTKRRATELLRIPCRRRRLVTWSDAGHTGQPRTLALQQRPDLWSGWWDHPDKRTIAGAVDVANPAGPFVTRHWMYAAGHWAQEYGTADRGTSLNLVGMRYTPYRGSLDLRSQVLTNHDILFS